MPTLTPPSPDTNPMNMTTEPKEHHDLESDGDIQMGEITTDDVTMQSLFGEDDDSDEDADVNMPDPATKSASKQSSFETPPKKAKKSNTVEEMAEVLNLDDDGSVKTTTSKGSLTSALRSGKYKSSTSKSVSISKDLPKQDLDSLRLSRVNDVEDQSYQILAKSNGDSSTGTNSTTRTSIKPRKLTRFFLKITVDDGYGKFHASLAKAFNTFLAVLIEAEPRALLVPWQALSQNRSTQTTSKIEPKPGSYLRFMHTGAEGNYINRRAGIKYLRIQLSLPSETIFEDMFDKMKESQYFWWCNDTNRLTLLPCQAINPVKICWLLRAHNSTTGLNEGISDLQTVLRTLLNDTSIGLETKVISKDKQTGRAGSKKKNNKKDSNFLMGVHIEVDAKRKMEHQLTLEKIYSGSSFPLGMNFSPIRSLDMPGMNNPSYEMGYFKCYNHQEVFMEKVRSTEIQINKFDEFLPAPRTSITLRQYLATLKIKGILACLNNRVFLGINQTSTGWYDFSYHEAHAPEAFEIVDNLVLILRDVLKVAAEDYVSPNLVFAKEDWTWDDDNHCSHNPRGGLFDSILQTMPGANTDDTALQNLSDLDLVMYQRANGNCDETVMSRTNRTSSTLKQLKANRRQSKSADTIILDTGSVQSNISNITGESKRTSATTHSTRERAAAEAAKERDSHYAEILSAKEAEMEKMRAQLLELQNTSNASNSAAPDAASDKSNQQTSFTEEVEPGSSSMNGAEAH